MALTAICVTRIRIRMENGKCLFKKPGLPSVHKQRPKKNKKGSAEPFFVKSPVYLERQATSGADLFQP
jgi:hypothetical protein